VKRLRRLLLELWILLPVAAVIGFLGPFGTYLMGDLMTRIGRWWLMLTGAYILLRPTMALWNWIARVTGLPSGSLVFWGMFFSSFPMALIWRVTGRDEVRLLGGYAGLLPFTILCSILVILVAWWAQRADNHLLYHYKRFPGQDEGPAASPESATNRLTLLSSGQSARKASQDRPRLYDRLSPQFEGDILALESEDHYVRVHGMRKSELLLMRLRDAIAEMDGTDGEQTHRSWWVTREAVAEITGTGRNRRIKLANGAPVLVARDSVDRLQQSGFLPT